jgi:hypothetical protein
MPSSFSRKYSGDVKIGPEGIAVAFLLKLAHIEDYIS